MPISACKPLMLPTPVTRIPEVAIISPFDPKMTPRHDLENTIKGLLERAERQLLAIHSAEDALPVVFKLRQLLRGLDYSTHRRSIAIFASEQLGKICYMDTEVEQRLVVDEPFRIRDLATAKKKEKEYLVMTLDRHQSRTFLGRDRQLRLIKSNTPQSISSNRFANQMDLGLGSVLKVYPLPVFVTGPDAVLDFFGRITQHKEHIADFIANNSPDLTEHQLLEMLTPHLASWEHLRQRTILQQMEKALTAGKLVCGLDNVKRTASSKNNRLLVIPADGRPGSDAFCRAGTIDEIAEKVLAGGGSIETVDSRLLEGFDNIAIIRYC